MSTRSQLINFINSNITQNSTQSVTGLKMNQILIDFANSFLVPDTDFPLLPSKGGTGVGNSDSETITLGGAMSTGGTVTIGSSLSTTGTFSSGGNFSTSSTVSITGAMSVGGALTTAAAFTQAGAFATTITSTGISNSTLPLGTDTLAGLGTNQTFSGNNVFETGTLTCRGNTTFNTGTVTFANGLTVSSGTATFGVTTLGGAVAANANITMADARNILVGTGTGTVIATTTSQKLAFWGGTPKAQQTNAIAAAAFTANSSGIADDTATWGGYTVGQIVAILKTLGIIA